MSVLVIKHGALGDIVQAFPAFAAIRAKHAEATITLLTAPAFADFLRESPWFDRIETDPRLPFWNLPALLRLSRRLRGYAMVYDLQTSSRSSRYFRLAGRPPWSGIAKGCAFPHADPARARMHTRERLAAQLAVAGIGPLPMPDPGWLARADVARFALPGRFGLLVPGASAHRPAKRWPPEHYRALAERLAGPLVLVGGPGEQAPQGMRGADLTGKTSLAELAAVVSRAAFAVGNDTGPMHLAAALGVPSVVLFSGASDPALTAPRYPDGGWPMILRAGKLADLPVATVLSSLP